MIAVLDASAAVRSVLQPNDGPWAEAIERADLVIAPALNDLFYFVLARRTGAILLTADKGLSSVAQQHGIRVI